MQKPDVTRQLKFEIEFMRLVNPMTGQQLGVIGLDRGGTVYVTAQMHPCALTNNDLGCEAYKRCYKAGGKVASFEGGFNVDGKWLLDELQAPFSLTVGGKTLTNVVLRNVVNGLINAAEKWFNRKGGIRAATVGGTSIAAQEMLLLKMSEEGEATLVESANEPVEAAHG